MFGILSRNQDHACMIWRSSSGNFGVRPNNSRALLESLTSTGRSPASRTHLRASAICTTSATADPIHPSPRWLIHPRPPLPGISAIRSYLFGVASIIVREFLGLFLKRDECRSEHEEDGHDR